MKSFCPFCWQNLLLILMGLQKNWLMNHCYRLSSMAKLFNEWLHRIIDRRTVTFGTRNKSLAGKEEINESLNRKEKEHFVELMSPTITEPLTKWCRRRYFCGWDKRFLEHCNNFGSCFNACKFYMQFKRANRARGCSELEPLYCFQDRIFWSTFSLVGTSIHQILRDFVRQEQSSAK